MSTPVAGPLAVMPLFADTSDRLVWWNDAAGTWETIAVVLGTGAVTSITAGTGLTGGTITSSGTIALAVPVSIANGGTNATTASVALGNLGGAPIASPTFTGTPAAPTAAPGTSTTQLATTQFVGVALGSYAPLASPALTGTPTAPTATAGTNTTQLATTAFVQTALGGQVTAVTAGTGLTGGGTSGAVTLALSVPVSVPNGGTGGSSFTANAVLAGNGALGIYASGVTTDFAGDMATPGTITINGAGGFTGNGTGAYTIKPTTGHAYLSIVPQAAGSYAGLVLDQNTAGGYSFIQGNVSGVAQWQIRMPDPTGSFFIYKETGTNAGNVLEASQTNGAVSFLGTNTNDSAPAGWVGEVVVGQVASGSAVALTNGTLTDLTTISLSPGDWQISCDVQFVPSGGATVVISRAWANSVATSVPDVGATTLPYAVYQGISATANITMVAGPGRALLAATTTFRLGCAANFASGAVSAFGWIIARRMR